MGKETGLQVLLLGLQFRDAYLEGVSLSYLVLHLFPGVSGQFGLQNVSSSPSKASGETREPLVLEPHIEGLYDKLYLGQFQYLILFVYPFWFSICPTFVIIQSITIINSYIKISWTGFGDHTLYFSFLPSPHLQGVRCMVSTCARTGLMSVRCLRPPGQQLVVNRNCRQL